MLTQLYIENIAVIEKVSVDFHTGLNVFTGETGAGKSILIDALSSVLGFRSSRNLIRSGAKKALVSASFYLQQPDLLRKLEKMGFEAEEGIVILSREMTSEGKNICKICGRPANVTMLKEIGSLLVDIHGQHDNQVLLSPENHLAYLDDYAFLNDLLAQYREKYMAMRRNMAEIKALQMDENEKQRQIELLSYQIEEITQAKLKPGQEEELAAERDKLLNSEKLAEKLNTAYLALAGDEDGGGALLEIKAALDCLYFPASYDSKIAKHMETLQDMYYRMEDIKSEIYNRQAALDFNPGRIEEIEQRLDTYFRIKLKYGDRVEDILLQAEQMQQQLDNIRLSDEKIIQLNQALNEQKKEVVALARQLTQQRQQAAEKFSAQVCEELRFLNMPEVRFMLRHETGPLNKNGADRMEFLISANPGEEPRPIGKIASGGELSRIMLAIKNVLAEKDSTPTLIFDEIDTGVSGKAAQKIGIKLKQAARNKQIICVTHLAQIAVYAQHHLLIEKQVAEGRSFTHIQPLEDGQRTEEIARIMSGENITQTTLKSAKELLQAASEQKI